MLVPASPVLFHFASAAEFGCFGEGWSHGHVGGASLVCLLCSACTVAIFDVVTEQLKHTWSSDEAGRPGARPFVSRLPRRSIHTCHRDIGPPTAPLSLSLFVLFPWVVSESSGRKRLSTVNAPISSICQLCDPTFWQFG